MLHIATVHFRSPRWIPIQARELRRHLPVPFRTWTSLEGISPSYGRHFDRVIEQGGPHAGKLNHLAIEIAAEADADDLLMFLDGDAFPIADPAPLIDAGLRAAPLLAVQRAENGGDPQPHPCFCVTSVATWRDLPGDWSKGYMWKDANGEPKTDVGANLMRRLELTGTPWAPVLRSNRRNPHPLFFGVYGDAIYHHGAGFRAPVSRSDTIGLPPIPPSDAPLLGPIARRLGEMRRRAQTRPIARRNLKLSEEILARIERDDQTWLDALV
ncbi:MAG: hypothetical protein ACM3N0_01155 [Chloroflexota bacterium]